MTDLVRLLLSLPTKELFIFNENVFHLNYNIIAEEQATGSQLQRELKFKNNKYRQELRKGVPLYITRKQANIFIPASL
jgi:hypothetical protein